MIGMSAVQRLEEEEKCEAELARVNGVRGLLAELEAFHAALARQVRRWGEETDRGDAQVRRMAEEGRVSKEEVERKAQEWKETAAELATYQSSPTHPHTSSAAISALLLSYAAAVGAHFVRRCGGLGCVSAVVLCGCAGRPGQSRWTGRGRCCITACAPFTHGSQPHTHTTLHTHLPTSTLHCLTSPPLPPSPSPHSALSSASPFTASETNRGSVESRSSVGPHQLRLASQLSP